MKFTKQDLLTLLIGLFLFASCKNPDGVGLDVDPGTAIQGTLVDNQVITSRTIQESAITSTAALSAHPLGYIVDPIFGKTESSIAMTVIPPSTAPDFGTSSTLDSAVLVLNLGKQFYGDTTTSRYSIDVYQLTNKITNYKSSDVQAHNATLLGNFNNKIYPNTPIKVYEIVAAKADTLRTMTAQIRIPLNKAFIQSNILGLSSTVTASTPKFIDAFKGLYAEVNKTSSTGTGGVAFIDFAASNSYLQLVYKKPNTSNGIDTLSTIFPIGSANSNASIVTSNIKHDYTGTDVKTQLDNPSTQYTVNYLQGLAGLKTKISFPNLANFSNTYGKVVVNRAELVVPLSNATYAYPFSAAQRLSLYRWDIAEQPAQLPDRETSATDQRAGTLGTNTITDAVFGGYYDSVQNRYVFIVTSYVQDLIDKKLVDYGTFIAPTSLTEFQITPTGAMAGRSVIGANTNTTNKMKLNIFYTKIN
ncbi:DUF4270 domain-containing protein [Pedobacter rhizosphaerae]|uniref:DUF4270 domain-containing protein n=1 Tax=Pedobacter rhizosphaerae TaxID=390241 RepID=A0A1H9W945_9SPHI|nr:DUF4270 domain-containing protein [Pedobacter rhizosphaerae]SES30299.1 protein of unknown function [Pedobacter rhizosphaerae]